MRKHRVARFVAGLLFFAALLYFLICLAAIAWMSLGGPSSGWGPGWRGWILAPVVVNTCLSAIGLLVFGTVLFFLTAIERNLTPTARRGTSAASLPAAAVMPPAKTDSAPTLDQAPPLAAAPTLAVVPVIEADVTGAEPLEILPNETKDERAVPIVEVTPPADEGLPTGLAVGLPPLAAGEVSIEAPSIGDTLAEADIKPSGAADASLAELPVDAAVPSEVEFPTVDILEPEADTTSSLPKEVSVAHRAIEQTLPEAQATETQEPATNEQAASAIEQARLKALQAKLAALEARLAAMETGSSGDDKVARD